jgi:hypothetical protein
VDVLRDQRGAARDAYGVIVRVIDGATFEVDAPATAALRATLCADRGVLVLRPRARLCATGGRHHADVDFR